jgi:uncharacterized protein YdeI (YjbR/CyaY-like superfamily)
MSVLVPHTLVHMPEVKFFATQSALRKWLEKNHDKRDELWIGFYNKQSGRGGIDYKQAVDEALCFGWIDGVRKKVDADSYTNRFSPRKPKSYWSAVNTKRADELIAEGRMRAPGLAAFEARDTAKTQRYSFERETAQLDAASEKIFRANKAAWEFWTAQPPGYRKVLSWYVISAKKEETRAARLRKLIEACANKKRMM